ncbi:MAG TPA: MgtC/SapB family protein [Anaerolineae bacterium]|nr:MgtC/SapB family protein [Anaerolineae bacterium]
MDTTTLFYRLGTALFIGILLGLQRQYAYTNKTDTDQASDTAPLITGVRTFALFSLTGGTAAYLSDILNQPWLFIVTLVIIGLFISLGYVYAALKKEDPGLTTEVAAILTVFIGALCYWGQLEVAAALGVVVAALLSLKFELHSLAKNLTREDIIATLKFAIITAIILPLLPNETFAPPPFDVLNPYKIWWMVILISGISFLGYILMKFVGTEQGIGATGFLGGLASSTAVTLSVAQQSTRAERLSKTFALAIMIAWTVMFARVLVEVAVTNLALLRVVWLPVVAGMVTGLLYCGYLYYTASRDKSTSDIDLSNPFELGPAIQFSLLYAIVLVLSRAGEMYFGNTGIYISSVISGLADVDAITLSMAELSQQGGSITTATASRAIVLAAVSNTVVKTGIVITAGSAGIRRAILPGAAIMVITALLVAFLA